MPKELIARTKRQFEVGTRDLLSHRKQWNLFADRLVSFFEEIKSEGLQQKLFENLYVRDSRKSLGLENGPRFVSMWWGRHPAGTGCIENPEKIAVEGGGAITFAQGIDGSVVCVIYPFKSELHQVKESHLVVGVFEKPCDITPRAYRSMTKAFFSYSLVSSIYGKPTLSDMARIEWLRLAGRIREVWRGESFIGFIAEVGKVVLGLAKAAAAS